MLKVCVKLAARPVGKPTDLVRLDLTTMPFTGICSTTELPLDANKAVCKIFRIS